jgi:hypothetical protein
VPDAGAENVVRTQVDVPAFAMGRYGPNAQAVLEQFLMLPVCADVRAVTVQVALGQVAVICVSALSGVGPSATVDCPPPTFRPPQPSVLRIAPNAPPERTEPQLPAGVPVMKRSVRGAVVLVVELVLVDVLVLLLLEDDVLVLLVVAMLVLLLLVDDVLVVVVDEVLLLVVEELVLLEVVVVVTVVGGPLPQSGNELATAPSATNCPGSSFLMVAASKRAQLRSLPVVMRITTSPKVPVSGTPVSLPTIFSTLVSFNTTTLIGTGPAGASLLMYL